MCAVEEEEEEGSWGGRGPLTSLCSDGGSGCRSPGDEDFSTAGSNFGLSSGDHRTIPDMQR